REPSRRRRGAEDRPHADLAATHAVEAEEHAEELRPPRADEPCDAEDLAATQLEARVDGEARPREVAGGHEDLAGRAWRPREGAGDVAAGHHADDGVHR